METENHRIAAIARTQHGLFTRSQAQAIGVNNRTLDTRVANGVYERLFPGVFGFPGTAETWHRRVAAAVLSTSPPAAASHLTAACLWGLTTSHPETIEVICRRHRRVRRRSLVVHESKDLGPSDIVIIDGIPTTTGVRTIVDLGASASLGVVARCLDNGLREMLFTLDEIHRFVKRVARPGRAGVGKIRPLIEERLAWSGLTESALEDAFRSLVNRAALPMPEPQFSLHDDNNAFVGRFDFAYRDQNVLIELDSERWHMDPDSFQRDREKQNRAHALGWMVYRFTWRQLIDRPEAVLRTLASLSA
jgi:hypothetical protein